MPQHVGLITTSYPRFRGDHAGTFVQDRALQLCKQGHRVTVLAPEPRFPTPTYDAYDSKGVRVLWVPYLRPQSLQTTFYRAGVPDNLKHPRAWPGALTAPWAMHRAIGKHLQECDTLESHWALPCGWLATFHTRGRPHRTVFHGSDLWLLERMPTPLSRSIARQILKASTCLQFVNGKQPQRFQQELRQRDRHEAKEKTLIQPMAPPPIPKLERPPKKRFSLSHQTWLYVGRLVPMKGVHRILQAAQQSNAQLIVLGDGPERPRLEQQAKTLGVQSQFLGWVPPTEIHRWMLRADRLVSAQSQSRAGREEGAPTSWALAKKLGLEQLHLPNP